MPETSTSSTSVFHADRPIETVAEDLLGVDAFVRRLVGPLLHAPDDGSLVVGVYGRWGTGKTSALHLLEAALDETTRYEGEAAQRTPYAHVVRFTPWLYADVETLLSAFFDTLAAGIGGLTTAPRRQRRRLEAALKGMSDFVVPATKLAGHVLGGPVGGAVAGLIADAAKGAAKAGADALAATEADRDEGRFRRKRDEAAALLRKLRTRGRPIRVVMTIDDLDRSAGVEDVLAMLKLVKLAADLPNIAYVIAMDREHIEDLLSEHVSERFGAEFLDKIVQVAVSLPPLEPKQLSHMLVEGATRIALDAGLDAASLGVDWDSPFGDYLPRNTFEQRLRPALRSPRDVRRILNAYRFAALTGESSPPLHAADLLMLATLQVVAPRAYEAVRVNRRFLLHEDSSFWTDSGRGHGTAATAQAKRDARFSAIVDGSPELSRVTRRVRVDAPSESTSHDEAPVTHEAVRGILQFLFPHALAPGPGRNVEGVRQWRADRDAYRICSPERFSTYFRLSPPPDEAPVWLVRETFRLLSDGVEEHLPGGEGTSRASNSIVRADRMAVVGEVSEEPVAPLWVAAFDELVMRLEPAMRSSLFSQIWDRTAAMTRRDARAMAHRLPELLRDALTDVGDAVENWADEVILTLTTYRSGDRGERDVEERREDDRALAVSVARNLIDAFASRDLRRAMDYAESLTQEGASLSPVLVPEARFDIAVKGVMYARVLFEQTSDVFGAFTSFGGTSAVWDYRHLASRAGEAVAGQPYGPLQTYLQELVGRVPARLSDLLACAAGWGNDSASFHRRAPREIRDSLGELVDLGWLDERVRRSVGTDVAPPTLPAEPLGARPEDDPSGDAQAGRASVQQVADPTISWPNLLVEYAAILAREDGALKDDDYGGG